MAEETTQNVAEAPQGQPQSEFKMPEKFANAKPEDIAKAYVELERTLGEQGAKLKDLERYSSLGKPDEIQQAIDWARTVYKKLEAGELVDKSVLKPAAKAEHSGLPWEAPDWDYKSDADKAKAMAEYARSEAQRLIEQKANEYGQQINQYRQLQGSEMQLLLDAINAAITSGGKTDVKSLLVNAAELATKSPQDLLKMAFENLTAKERMEAEIEKRVNAAIAEAKQKMDNERLSVITEAASPKPRFARAAKRGEETNREIIQKLAKAGINLL